MWLIVKQCYLLKVETCSSSFDIHTDTHTNTNQPTHTHTHAYIFIFIEIANNYSIKADQTAKMQKANNFQDVLDDKVRHFTYLHVYNDTMQTHRTNFP